MPSDSDINAMIERLAGLPWGSGTGGGDKWKDAWAEIRDIGRAFKQVRFTTAQERQEAWMRFQSVVENVKAAQSLEFETAREAVNGLQAVLDALNTIIETAEATNRWGDVWAEIKGINQTFRNTRFPSRRDREDLWMRYQEVIERVKASQQRARDAIEERVRTSERHLAEIRSHCRGAEPPSDFADMIIAIATAGMSLLIKGALEAILGPWDEKKLDLQRCSESLKAGWTHIKQYKSEMFRSHKDEAFEMLRDVQDKLDAAWEEWRTGRQRAIDEYREEKRSKREAWEQKMHDNVAKLEERLSRLEGVIEHKRSHLRDLEDKRDSAHNDGFRERVEGWISAEEEKISDIEDEIGKVRGWIDEIRAKLDE